FIPPCSPIPAKAVPAGDGWVHELKSDGYRFSDPQGRLSPGSLQPQRARLQYFSERFPSIVQELGEQPTKAVVLYGEVVASDADGRPNFARLHVRWTRPRTIHLWAFDLLALNGRNLRLKTLVKRPGAPAGSHGAFRLPSHARRSI